MVIEENYQGKLVSVFLIFWLFWFSYNQFNGYTLDSKTIFLIFLTLFAFTIGWAFRKRKKKTIAILNPKRYYKVSWLFRIVVVINIFLSVVSIAFIYHNGFDIRSLVFTSTGLFDSMGITFFINNFIKPLTYATIIISVTVSIEGKNFINYGYLLLFLLSISTLGRFPLYFMIYIYAISRIINKKHQSIVKRKRNFIKILSLILVIGLILYLAWELQISKMEFEGRNLDAFEIIKKYLLNYHIIGFHMLDHFVLSGSNKYVFPTTSLGQIGWYLHLLTKYSGFLPVFPNSYKNLMEIYNSGLFLTELNQPANAFTTCILPFYADGGSVGVFFIFFIIGWFSKSGVRYNIYTANPIFISVAFFMTFSLFMPLISTTFVPTILFILLFNKYLKTKFVLK